MVITSTKNELVKAMRRLKERSARRDMGLHLIEGERLVFDALESGVVPETIFIEEGRTKLSQRLEGFGLPYIEVSSSVLQAVADTPSPQGIAASVRTPDTSLPSELGDGLFVALDALQDPGNLGTIIRTADAMGAAGILLGRGCTDAFSPKALRASMGSSYHLPIYEAELGCCIPLLKRQSFLPICGHLNGRIGVPDIGENRRILIVIGNEGNGVSDEVASLCELVRLPMYGRAESLNASVAASILIFCAAEAMHAKE